MRSIERRAFIGAVLLALLPPGHASAASISKEERAARIHRRRNEERWQRDLIRRDQNRLEEQRSRPIPPTGSGSRVVPNR